MKNSLVEIYDEVKKAKSKAEKKDILKKNFSVSLAATLKMLFDPTLVFNLPRGLPEKYVFNKQPYSSLERMIRSFPPLANREASPAIEKAWLRLMVPLAEDEVRLATALKDKDLDIGLTLADVQDLFPSLFANVTPEALASVEAKKTSGEANKVDGEGSKTPEPIVIPDDPYGDAFKEAKIDEDSSLPSPVSENPGVIGIEEILIDEANFVEDVPVVEKKPAPRKPAKRTFNKKD